MSTLTVSTIQSSGGGGTAATLASVNGGPISGARNRVINGDMRIDQRNAGASVTPTNGQYTVDRWRTQLSQSSKFTAQQNAGSVTPPAGFTNYLGVTSSSAYTLLIGDYFGVNQFIEGYNMADLTWGTANAKTVTLSFWVRSSLTGTFSGGIRTGDGSNYSYPFTYTISSANTWEQKSITIVGPTSGTWLTTNGQGLDVWFSLGTGSTFSGTAGSWASANYVAATGATSVVGTSGATFYLTGVQLETGTVATPFERRSFGQELALCQRYYETLNGGTVKAAGYGTSGAEGSRQYFGFAITKRASPTMTFPTLGAANCTVISNSSANGFNVTATLTSTGTFGYDYSAGTVAASIEL